MSLVALSFSRNNSWAIIRFATFPSIPVPRKMILSFNSLEKISKAELDIISSRVQALGIMTKTYY